MNPSRFLKSEKGAVLVVSMLILVVLTIIGVAATNTSVIETLIANSHKKKQAVFYAAEAGIEHAKASMVQQLEANSNTNNVGEGTVIEWDFLFSDDYEDVTDPEFEGQKYLIEETAFGNHTYTVTFYDPDFDAASGSTDSDGVIWVRSEGVGPSGGKAIVEVSYLGQFAVTGGGKTISDYSAQDKAGAGKESSGKDTEAIDSFGDQLNRQI